MNLKPAEVIAWGAFILTGLGFVRAKAKTTKWLLVIVSVIALGVALFGWSEENTAKGSNSTASSTTRSGSNSTNVSTVLGTNSGTVMTNLGPVTINSPSTPAPPAFPPPDGFNIVQRAIPSEREDAPYAIEITLQAKTTVEKFGIEIHCDQEIAAGESYLVGEFARNTVITSYSDDRRRFRSSWTWPPVTPQNPVVIVLMSKSQFKVLDVKRVKNL